MLRLGLEPLVAVRAGRSGEWWRPGPLGPRGRRRCLLLRRGRQLGFNRTPRGRAARGRGRPHAGYALVTAARRAAGRAGLDYVAAAAA